jgi:hypothetical protein
MYCDGYETPHVLRITQATLRPSPAVKLVDFGLYYDDYGALCVFRSLRNRRHADHTPAALGCVRTKLRAVRSTVESLSAWRLAGLRGIGKVALGCGSVRFAFACGVVQLALLYFGVLCMLKYNTELYLKMA